ncbi:unnamed protein product [Rotaria sp. Silwood1]|nr:unnamed protein product [Rotaria sp. Silwood1]
MIIPWTNPCSIIYLTIKSCSLKEYDLLLQRLPYLRTFSTEEFIIDKSNQLNSSPSISKCYPQLASLMIGNGSFSMTDFELILFLTPSLARLKLISYKSILDSITNGSDWEYLIHNKLPNLKIFEFFFSYHLQKENEAEDLTLVLDRFRTSFWLKEKKWIVACDYVFRQNVIYIYTTPVCTKDFEQQWKSIQKACQTFPFITIFKLLSIDNEFHSTIHRIHGIDDLAESRVLRLLVLGGNHIETKGAQYLADSLRNKMKLTTLDLRDNKIGDQGALYIADALRDNMVLRVLNLSSNGISTTTADHLYECFRNKNKLVQFDLKGNDQCDAVAMYASFQIRNNKSVHKLKLNQNRITNIGAAYIGDMLKENKTLVQINLTGNQIGNTGVQYLTNVLQQHSTLAQLYLGDNQIDDQGVQYLTHVLETNIVLKELHLDSNSITGQGAKHLADALSKTKTLTTLKLRGNEIGPSGTKYLIDAQQNRTVSPC